MRKITVAVLLIVLLVSVVSIAYAYVNPNSQFNQGGAGWFYTNGVYPVVVDDILDCPSGSSHNFAVFNQGEAVYAYIKVSSPNQYSKYIFDMESPSLGYGAGKVELWVQAKNGSGQLLKRWRSNPIDPSDEPCGDFMGTFIKLRSNEFPAATRIIEFGAFAPHGNNLKVVRMLRMSAW